MVSVEVNTEVLVGAPMVSVDVDTDGVGGAPMVAVEVETELLGGVEGGDGSFARRLSIVSNKLVK